jgi:hypothetical protein
MDHPSSIVVHITLHICNNTCILYKQSAQIYKIGNKTMYIDFQNQTLTFIPSFGEVTYSLVLGQKNLPKSLCNLCKGPTNFVKQFCEYSFSLTCFSNPCRNDGDGNGAHVKHDEPKRKKHSNGNVDYSSQIN